ncbi:MAG: zinc ribbon domain-containing protein, partial [Planctomycetaceae bacterium]|nr:zinc ribbon domain-containing protein [Planctomycetaceae bacterium]
MTREPQGSSRSKERRHKQLFCPSCGAQRLPQARFCTQCGAALLQKSTVTSFEQDALAVADMDDLEQMLLLTETESQSLAPPGQPSERQESVKAIQESTTDRSRSELTNSPAVSARHQSLERTRPNSAVTPQNAKQSAAVRRDPLPSASTVQSATSVPKTEVHVPGESGETGFGPEEQKLRRARKASFQKLLDDSHVQLPKVSRGLERLISQLLATPINRTEEIQQQLQAIGNSGSPAAISILTEFSHKKQ